QNAGHSTGGQALRFINLPGAFIRGIVDGNPPVLSAYPDQSPAVFVQGSRILGAAWWNLIVGARKAIETLPGVIKYIHTGKSADPQLLVAVFHNGPDKIPRNGSIIPRPVSMTGKPVRVGVIEPQSTGFSTDPEIVGAVFEYGPNEIGFDVFWLVVIGGIMPKAFRLLVKAIQATGPGSHPQVASVILFQRQYRF